MNYKQILFFSFAWLKDRRAIKFIAMAWVATIVLFIAWGALAVFLFKDIIVSLFAGYAPTMTTLLLDTAKIAAMLLIFSAASLPLYIAYALFMYYIQVLIALHALHNAKMPCAKFPVFKFLRLIVLLFGTLLVAFFSWFEKRYLSILILSVIFALLTFIAVEQLSIAAGLVSLALLLFYFVVVIYNYFRLSQGLVIFLSKDVAIMDAINESWWLTRKRIWSIVATVFVVGIPAYIFIAFLAIIVATAFAIILFPVYPSFPTIFHLGNLLALYVIQPFAMLISGFAVTVVYRNIVSDAGKALIAKKEKKKGA